MRLRSLLRSVCLLETVLWPFGPRCDRRHRNVSYRFRLSAEKGRNSELQLSSEAKVYVKGILISATVLFSRRSQQCVLSSYRSFNDSCFA